MIKIRKGNVVYRVAKEHVDNYIRKGFVIVDEPVEQVELKTEEELLKNKPVHQMTKVELIELAEVRGITLSGEEKINDLRQLLR